MSPLSVEGAPEEGAPWRQGRVCVECGEPLPPGWADLYCGEHGGFGDLQPPACARCGVALGPASLSPYCPDCDPATW